MKKAMINYRPDWTFWLPDSVAEWDAISHWERERLSSMEAHLRPGMTLFDVGTEHGWLTAVYGEFVGHENVVLFEPSPEFWVNIRLTWERNGFPLPLASIPAFVGEEDSDERPAYIGIFPPHCYADDVECPGMAYRYIGQHEIPVVTIDSIARDLRKPDAITIDIEGAELLALRGAEETLHTARPLVWVSIHEDLMMRDFSHDPRDLHRFMESVGYVGEYLGTDHEAHWFFCPEERL